jgi:thiol-disulfide isomerase/thioredoxin
MLAISTMLTIWVMPLGFEPSRDDVAQRFRDLKEAAAQHREANLPWLTFRKFAPEFLRLAQEAPDDPVSLAALLAVGEYGSQCIDTCKYDGKPHSRLMERALELLAADRLNDERVGRLCLVLSRLPSPARESFLRRVVQESKNPLVRGRACLALAELLKTKLRCIESLAESSLADIGAKSEATWGGDYLAHLRGCDRAVLGADVERLLDRVVGEFGAVAFVRGTFETPVWRGTAEKDVAARKTLGMVAEADLEEIRHLAPGCIAPEIEGRDAENVPFKLSDYRGKVVVLTFSGNWCGPCRSLYPYKRELVARLRGRQFALLSVNTDETIATLQKSIRTGEVTWRCWWDGGPGRPIASRWNVRAWPTIYVLDARGVIRAKNPRDESLDKLIDGLLEEGPDAIGATQPK